MNGSIVVFAKAPRPGAVKTRMCPPLDPDEAAGLYSAMLDDVLEATLHMARSLDLKPVLTVHPPEAQAELAHRAPHSFDIVAQRGRDLSERMAWAIAEAGATGASPILIRGSDSPTLGFQVARAAVAALQEVDAVIAPDVDGGYNLLGLRTPVAGLFDHPMSTESVLDDTLAGAAARGLTTRVLDETFDLDTGEDLALLARRRDRIDVHGCHRTLAYLDDRDLWSRLAHEPSSPRLGRG
ncbi:MAG: TIGR04282 family arsenosugar biosynthesis glycosyltransferase [Myxococcota bacterium]